MGKHLPIMAHHDAETVERIRAFDLWDDTQRRASGWFAGLAIFPKVTRETIYIAWRHWPHLLCWQWILAWHWGYNRRFFHFWRSSPGAAGGEHWTLRLLWLGYLSYQRQASDRIPALGPKWREAPVIFPKSLA